MDTSLLAHVKNARRVGTPLLAITTPDQPATAQVLVEGLGNGKPVPTLEWDLIQGLRPRNDAGAEALVLAGIEDPDTLKSPTECLVAASRLPERCVTMLHNAHRYLDAPDVAQAIANLRDPYKASRRTLVLLGASFKLPVELQQDVCLLTQEYPDEARLAEIVEKQFANAALDAPAPALVDRAVDALRGLASFPAEEATAQCLSKSVEGFLDVDRLWDRKKAAVEQTPGLRFEAGGATFADIGGLAQVKFLGTQLFAGEDAPCAVVRIDEIEKALGGAGANGIGDTSGTSQDALGVFLSAMEDNGWTGLILVGPAGSGKSIYSKALGKTHQVPTLVADLNAAKGSLVGQSEAQIRGLVRQLFAIAGRRLFVVATCNRLDTIPPELKRRFTLGVWFCDLPSDDEKATIWPICEAQAGLSPQPRPDDTGWSGAEIRNCCDVARKLRLPLVDAAQFVLPVSRSHPEQVASLRAQAKGKFFSCSYPGPYRGDTAVAPAPAKRVVRLDG